MPEKVKDLCMLCGCTTVRCSSAVFACMSGHLQTQALTAAQTIMTVVANQALVWLVAMDSPLMRASSA